MRRVDEPDQGQLGSGTPDKVGAPRSRSRSVPGEVLREHALDGRDVGGPVVEHGEVTGRRVVASGEVARHHQRGAVVDRDGLLVHNRARVGPGHLHPVGGEEGIGDRIVRLAGVVLVEHHSDQHPAVGVGCEIGLGDWIGEFVHGHIHRVRRPENEGIDGGIPAVGLDDQRVRRRLLHPALHKGRGGRARDLGDERDRTQNHCGQRDPHAY